MKDYNNGFCSGQMESFIMVLVEDIPSFIRSSKSFLQDFTDILK